MWRKPCIDHYTCTEIDALTGGSLAMIPTFKSLICLCGLLAMNTAVAQSCFFSEDFEAGMVPSGWVIGPQVIQFDLQGDSIGMVDPWYVGNADQANAAGFFEVVDFPPNNVFIMANDDGPPCDCDLNDIALESPSIDLTGRSSTTLGLRLFHEALYGVADPVIEVSDNGGSWNALDTVFGVLGTWQDVLVDLSAFDGSNDLRFRITWSDSMNWASGIAVDDICVYERLANDVVLSEVFHEMVAEDAFDPSIRTLQYSTIPLTQTDTLHVGGELTNRGTQVLSNVQLSIDVSDPLGPVGTFLPPAVSSLAPGESVRVFANTGFVPSVSGPVQLNASVSHSATDDDPSNDSGQTLFDVTEPGQLYGHAVMSPSGTSPEYAWDSDSTAMGVGVLLETRGNGDHIYGIGALLAPNTAPGTRVQGFLFDASLQVLDTTYTTVIDQSHINESAAGNYMYLRLDSSYSVDQDRDIIAMLFASADSGHFLSIHTSGVSSVGEAFEFDLNTAQWDFPLVVPMIRGYFSDPLAVGYSEHIKPAEDQLVAFPNPAVEHVYIHWKQGQSKAFQWEVHDLTGRIKASGLADSMFSIDVNSWKRGVYLITVRQGDTVNHGRFVVSR